MKYENKPLIIFVCCLLSLFLISFTAGCTSSDEAQTDLAEIKELMNLAEERLFSINWNMEHPGNIRAQLMGSEEDFSNVFNILSSMQPASSYEAQEIYALRALSCSYIDMIASMMDLANVIEHQNYAGYYASLYDTYNWQMEIMTADSALASARNNLYSAKYRISGVNMNMVPLELQGEVTEMKVRIEEMEILMNNLADEFATVLK
ncbi:MAG: hypothetical protein JXQ82_01970 [Methanomicrobiaceae archaeon]|nr:hypothetical protein [Methanomicrobiaceae archaeon]